MTKKAFKYNYPSNETREGLERVLLKNMRRHLPRLRKLLHRVNGHKFGNYNYEYHVYTFYSGSFKVFHVQYDTIQIVAALTALSPEGRPLSDRFRKIVGVGTRRRFRLADNNHWMERTGSIVHAFFHARCFLEMAVKYGEPSLDPPRMLAPGWCTLLCLYGIR
jgi:hypothetical protein